MFYSTFTIGTAFCATQFQDEDHWITVRQASTQIISQSDVLSKHV